MANVEVRSGCSGHAQHSSNISNNHDVPWTVWVNEDQVCVRFTSATSTNASVNVWVEDSDGNGALSDTNFWVSVPPQGETGVIFWDFGLRADQVTPRDRCILHTVVHNDDSESTGVELYHEVY